MRKAREVIVCIHSGKSTSRVLPETITEIYQSHRKMGAGSVEKKPAHEKGGLRKEIYSADSRE